MPPIELFQFAGSHFNEKARWGLDLKHVEHRRTSLMPGPHMRTMKKLTGATETPALVDDAAVVAGSTAILEHLERRFPQPALFPEDAAQRERALAIVQRWDAEVGPSVRLAKFFEVMDSDYAVETFCAEQSALSRGIYRAMFPVIGRVMKRNMGIDAEAAVAALEITRGAFDFVAKEPGPAGYLVGDRFSVADLTCACLLMPCLDTSEWGGPHDALTPKTARWRERWATHPGAEWVREMYRRHRNA